MTKATCSVSKNSCKKAQIMHLKFYNAKISSCNIRRSGKNVYEFVDTFLLFKGNVPVGSKVANLKLAVRLYCCLSNGFNTTRWSCSWNNGENCTQNSAMDTFLLLQQILQVKSLPDLQKRLLPPLFAFLVSMLSIPEEFSSNWGRW